MSSRTTRRALLVGSLAAGVALAWLVHGLGERLSRRPAAPAEQPAAANPAPPERIVALTPAVIEVIHALGAFDRLVGGTRFATFPAEAKALPDLGGIMDTNLERLAALAPDLVIVQGTNEQLARFCADRGIPLLSLKLESIDDLKRVSRELGTRIGLTAEGDKLARRIAADLDRVRGSVAGADAVPCFISVDRRPGQLSNLLTAGRGTFLDEVVSLAGGRNVFGDQDTLYPTISKESLLARAPEVVLELSPDPALAPDRRDALVRDWDALPGLPAVQRDRVEVIARDDALLPCPRVAGLAGALAAALHPDRAGLEADQ